MSPAFGVWPTLPPRSFLRRPAARLPFPLSEPGVRLFARARHGLFAGLHALGIAPGDEVLVPAYHHGSEVEAIERAGGRCAFYAGGVDLAPDPRELQGLLGPRTFALHLIHYDGFPQDGRRWLDWCRGRGLRLIEDAAPSWLAERDGIPVGALGDLAVFSLYKTVGVPDGGAVVCAETLPEPGTGAGGAPGAARKMLAWLAQRAPTGIPQHGSPGPQVFDAEREFALGDPSSGASRATRALLPRLSHPGVAARRRRNYGILLEELGELVPPPFDRLPAGASPWFLPIEIHARERVREELRRMGVNAMSVWAEPHPSLPVEDFPEAARRRSTTLALPVHQGLAERDLAAIARRTLRCLYTQAQ